MSVSFLAEAISIKNLIDEQRERAELHFKLWQDKITSQGLGGDKPVVKLFPSVRSALKWATQGREPAIKGEGNEKGDIPGLTSDDHIQILVTGTMYLIGDVLHVLGENAE